MADRGARAARRAARRNGPVENAAVDIAEVVDNRIDVESDSSSDNELLEEVVRVPHGRARPPAVIAPLAMDPGLWLNMVNVKPPYLLDLEIDSMKKFILEYKRYSQKCPRQLLRSMQQFVLEEHMEVVCSEAEMEMEEIMELPRDDFITAMIKIHQADSSRYWRIMIRNAKMEKSDLSLTTYVQYVEDFRFWVNVAGRPHRIPDKEIAKCFVNGLKPELFREEMYARSFENLDDVIREAREELRTYRKITDISDRAKRSEIQKRSSLKKKRLFSKCVKF